MSRDFYFLKRENMPCLYDLSFDFVGPAIIVKTHKDFLAQFPNFDNSPKIKSLEEKFDLCLFHDGKHGNGHFGFGGVFNCQGSEGNFAIFRITIPQVKKPAEKICPLCNGDGRGLFGYCLKCQGKGKLPKVCNRCNGIGHKKDGGVCWICQGEGIEFYHDWMPLWQATASLSVFFDLAFLASEKDKAVASDFPQLISIDTAVERQNNSLDGTYSIPLVNWLISAKPDEVSDIRDAMISVWQKLFGQTVPCDEYEFSVRIHQRGRVSFSCPGENDCCVYVSGSENLKIGRGVNFFCHNVDTPAQQLTLLTALAALCGKARREIVSLR